MKSATHIPHSHLINTSSEFYFTQALPKKGVFQQQGRDQLIRKIEILMSKNDELEEKKELLMNNIYDLRKVLEFVGKESLEEVKYLHQKNSGLNKKMDSLEKALTLSHKKGGHLSRCASYWSQFLQ